MDTTTSDPSRTAHLLALMKQGDDAFNAQDVATMNAVHHRDMIAHIPGSTKPLEGRAAHAAAMGQFFRTFPDVHVHNDPYPIQFGRGDWITVVSRATGTFTGEMILPDGRAIPSTGLLQTMQQVGGSLGLAILVTVFGSASRDTAAHPLVAASRQMHVHHVFAQGVAGTFSVSTGFAACTLLVALVAISAAAAGQPLRAA